VILRLIFFIYICHMGVTKTQMFTDEQNRMAELAKALAHPARIAIIQHLLKAKSCVCGDIVAVLPLAQSTVSQHLKELKQVGIIRGEIEPPTVCYCINDVVWKEAKSIFGGLFENDGNVTCCS
jgi:ArsR family transcriptional regulator